MLRLSKRAIAVGLLAVGLLILALVGIPRLSSPDRAAGPAKELVVVSYGGAFQEAQRKAFFEPFERATGIKIIEATWSGEYAKLKTMVESGNVTWDLVTAAEGSIITRGVNDGILERIDYRGIDRQAFYPEALTDYSVGMCYFSTVMAYNRNDYPEGTARPQSWADFWDTRRFPGPRSLRNDPRTTLEFALLADGVPSENLYPLDVDRAFRSLDRIRPSVSVWWTTGSQPPQLLASGEVKLSSVFNGRIWTAAMQDKVPLAVEWNGGALDLDSWIIPKGAKNRDAALALIRFTSRPEVQAELTRYINYGPTLRQAYDRLPPATRAVLPSSPENRARSFLFNREWWAQNESAVLERWTQWQLGK
ncbi:MAG TPA: ABC transporter substrate-binding protein [Longimicrobium sp.]